MTSSNGNIFRVTGHLWGNSPVPGEFPTQRPVTRSFDVFFDLRLNKRLSKQSWGWWFETLSRSLWRHRNERCRFSICSFWNEWFPSKMLISKSKQDSCIISTMGKIIPTLSIVFQVCIFDTLRSEQNVRYFAHGILHTFYLINDIAFWFNFYWSLFLRVRLAANQHSFRKWLRIRRQTIARTNVNNHVLCYSI